MTRERSNADADGARQGAAEAIQGADRFHLLQHGAEALAQGCRAHGQVLTAVHAVEASGPHPPRGWLAWPSPSPRPPPHRRPRSSPPQRRARRLADRCSRGGVTPPGWSGEAIARQLGMGRTTGCRAPSRRRHFLNGKGALIAARVF